MKKIISVAGARPNFMKVAPIDRALKVYSEKVKNILVHTGQHYDFNMSDAFIKDLNLPQPAEFLGVGSASHSVQTAKIMIEFEKVCETYSPDLVIVVGDVNSTIACTLTAVKMGIKTAHVEGGLRSFDRTMPEEINRIATDAICDYCFVTEESAITNLRNSGFNPEHIYFVGNTMIDSLIYAIELAKKSSKISELGLENDKYVLITLHRPTNVDFKEKLEEYYEIFKYLSNFRKIVFPIHPRTSKNLEKFDLQNKFMSLQNLILIEPQGYIDFLSLMINADFVITDSGGIQEETTYLGIPCLTVRTTTERPITVELGTNVLVKPEYNEILKAIDNTLKNKIKTGKIPPLWDGNAGIRIADIIVNKILSH